MSVEIQPSLWESVQPVRVIDTLVTPVGVVKRKTAPVRKTLTGQHLEQRGNRWRAVWRTTTRDGRRQRHTRQFPSVGEARAFLDALPRSPVESPAARRTLRDAVEQLRERGRGGYHCKWVLDECADLLGVHLDEPRLPAVIDSILLRRAQHRQPQGKPAARWELACEVRRADTGWEALTDGQWRPVTARAHFAPRLDALLTHLAGGKSGLERDLPVPRDVLRNPGVRTLVKRVEVARVDTQAVSRTTVLACRAMLFAALPKSAQDAIPDPREVRVQGESKDRKRKRDLTRSLGGRGLEPDGAMIERVLREARRLGSIPPAEGESVTHLNARRAVALIAATGLRSGEARALQWRDLDLNANRLWVESSLDQSTEQRKSPKTDESQRELRVEFASLRGLGDGLLDDLRSWRGNAPDTAWVFPREDGKPMRREALLDAVDELVVGLGLRKGLRVHDLRHCWARYALHLCAVEVAGVSKALGHANIMITLTLYGSAVAGVMD